MKNHVYAYVKTTLIRKWKPRLRLSENHVDSANSFTTHSLTTYVFCYRTVNWILKYSNFLVTFFLNSEKQNFPIEYNINE